MQPFTVSCAKFHTRFARKLLLSIAVLKIILNYKVFSTKLQQNVWVARIHNYFLGTCQKVFADPCL